MSAAPQDFPFNLWIAAARQRSQYWRLFCSIVLIGATWVAWSLLLILAALGLKIVDQTTLRSLTGQADLSPSFLHSIAAVCIALGGILGFGIGAWGALRLFHRRDLKSVLAWNGQLRAREFSIGCVLACIYLLASLALSWANGYPPHRSPVTVEQWTLALVPMSALILLQAASEEIVFRGFLPQQMAVRFASPVVWAGLPSLLFGLLHGGNVPGDPRLFPFVIASATLLGLAMTMMVWRTGSLAAAIGFHFVNNVMSLMVVGSDAGYGSIGLFVWSADEMTTTAISDLLVIGLFVAFIASPLAPLPRKPHGAARKNETLAAP